MPQGPQNTIRVRITSIDGNIDHPFRPDQKIGEVHQFAYERLVRDKSQTSLASTWIEFGQQRIDDAQPLTSIVTPDRGHGDDIDVTVTLAWTSQGG